MIRIVKMSGTYYGYKIDSLRSDALNIETFVEEGSPVLIVNELDEVEEFGIDRNDIKMVE